jgi:cell division protein FtsB
MSEPTTDQNPKRRIVRRLRTMTPARAVPQSSPEAEVTAAPATEKPQASTSSAEPRTETAPATLVSLRDRLAAKKLPRPAWLPQAAAVAIALGLGWLGASAFRGADREATQASALRLVETAESLRQGHQDVLRLTGDVKALKVAIETLKDSVDRSKAELSTRQSQLSERLDRADRAPQDTIAKLAKLAEQLDRVEAAGKAPVQKLTTVDERLERMERQIGHLQAAAATKSAAAAPAPVVAAAAASEPVQTGSFDAKPVSRDAPLDGWVLHEVYNGMALIESRDRRLLEVGLGAPIPGVGRVEGIERRGRRWVVVTAKGLITMER